MYNKVFKPNRSRPSEPGRRYSILKSELHEEGKRPAAYTPNIVKIKVQKIL